MPTLLSNGNFVTNSAHKIMKRKKTFVDSFMLKSKAKGVIFPCSAGNLLAMNYSNINLTQNRTAAKTREIFTLISY